MRIPGAWRHGEPAPEGTTGLELRLDGVFTLLNAKDLWTGQPGWGTAHIDVGLSCVNSNCIRITSLTEPVLLWKHVEPAALRLAVSWREPYALRHPDCVTLDWPYAEAVPSDRVSSVKLVRWGGPKMAGIRYRGADIVIDELDAYLQRTCWHMLWPDELRSRVGVWLDHLEEQGAIKS